MQFAEPSCPISLHTALPSSEASTVAFRLNGKDARPKGPGVCPPPQPPQGQSYPRTQVHLRLGPSWPWWPIEGLSLL